MALFASHRSAQQNNHLIEIKAGKCTASLVSGEEQIQIVPQEGAGLIYLHKTDDGLMRFCYKHRESGNVVDDLIVFPSDAIFVPVDENPEARVYLFKFKNSTMDRWLFFWMQDGDASKDEERCKRMNDLLNDVPSATPSRGAFGSGRTARNMLRGVDANELMRLIQSSTAQGGAITEQQLSSLLSMNPRDGTFDPAQLLSSLSGGGDRGSATPASSGAAAASNLMTTPAGQIAGTPQQPPKQPTKNRATVDDLRNILNSVAGTTNNRQNSISLSDLFSGDTNATSSRQAIAESAARHAKQLTPHLPNQEPVNADQTELLNTIGSPQFQQAVGMIDAALHSGSGASLLQQFGFPQSVLQAASRADVASLAEGLQLAAIGEREKTNEGKKGEKESGESEPPAAKRNKPDDENKKDDSKDGGGANTGASDGMELD